MQGLVLSKKVWPFEVHRFFEIHGRGRSSRNVSCQKLEWVSYMESGVKDKKFAGFSFFFLFLGFFFSKNDTLNTDL